MNECNLWSEGTQRGIVNHDIFKILAVFGFEENGSESTAQQEELCNAANLGRRGAAQERNP